MAECQVRIAWRWFGQIDSCGTVKPTTAGPESSPTFFRATRGFALRDKRP